MQNNNKQNKSVSNLISQLDVSLYKYYLIYFLLGIVLREIYYFASFAGNGLSTWLEAESISPGFIFFCKVCFSLLTCLYLYLRRVHKNFYAMVWSSHPELLLLLVLGAKFSSFHNGLGAEYYQKILIDVHPVSTLFLFIAPFLMATLNILNSVINFYIQHNKTDEAVFLNDDAITDERDDLFDINEKAKRFAIAVLNKNAKDSLVFGVDSPWGAGKSSFINMCSLHWKSLGRNKPIVYRFEPIKYLEQSNLAEKLANEMIAEIRKESFDPYLSSTFESYLKLINNSNKISILGFEINLIHEDSMKSSFDRLQKCLDRSTRKIIVVIDDLDRLSWDESKRILYSIKQSFKLHNVTYVLCYDTQNLAESSGNKDVSDIRDFLEKYINIKLNLFIDKLALADLVSTESEKLLQKVLTRDPFVYKQIENTLSQLKGFYFSNDYYKHAHFLGDLRKVKRLINSMLLFDFYSYEFDIANLNSEDLVNLMILNISYPNLFRKIYNAETYGGSEIFSLTLKGGVYQNSVHFPEELKFCSPNEQLLLEQLFSIDTLKKTNGNSLERLDTSTRACINGISGFSRNLENYLNVITKIKSPELIKTTSSYAGYKEAFLNDASLSSVFIYKDFSGVNANSIKVGFLNTLANSLDEMNSTHASEFLKYVLLNIHEYSILSESGLQGSHRHNLIYVFLQVLDGASWKDTSTSKAPHTNRIQAISNWIYGERERIIWGVVPRFTKNDRGVLGYYDLLLFRLYCCANRDSKLFHIFNSLAQRPGAFPHMNTPSSSVHLGQNTDEMTRNGLRELSQSIVQRFQLDFIDHKRNIFKEVESLTLKQLAPSGENYSLEDIQRAKIGIVGFIIYQLTNKTLSYGVGCGYYSETRDDDTHEIYYKMNKYLFGVCFNPFVDRTYTTENFEFFLDYLLSQLGRPIGADIDHRSLIQAELSIVLNMRDLTEYWKEHKVNIKSLKLDETSKIIYHPNYTVSYAKDLHLVFEFLDTLI